MSDASNTGYHGNEYEYTWIEYGNKSDADNVDYGLLFGYWVKKHPHISIV